MGYRVWQPKFSCDWSVVVSLTETIYACDRVLICFVFQLFVWYSCVLVVAGMTTLGLGQCDM